MTDCFKKITAQFQDDNNSWIIEELKTWETAFDFTYAFKGSWYKYNDLKTLEIRIGEPTFDYKILVKRIIQASRIGKKIKDILGIVEEEREAELIDNKALIKYISKNISEIDYKGKLEELNKKLEELKPKVIPINSTAEYLNKIKTITNNRTVLINKEQTTNQ